MSPGQTPLQPAGRQVVDGSDQKQKDVPPSPVTASSDGKTLTEGLDFSLLEKKFRLMSLGRDIARNIENASPAVQLERIQKIASGLRPFVVWNLPEKEIGDLFHYVTKKVPKNIHTKKVPKNIHSMPQSLRVSMRKH